MDKWSPTNLVPLDKWSLEYSVCPGGQSVMIWIYGDQIGWGPFVQGDQIFGTICPGGQKLIVQGDQFFSDHLSMGTESGGPEVWGSIGFGTK